MAGPSDQVRGHACSGHLAQRCRVGKGGRETSIDALRRIRHAHAVEFDPPRGVAWARREERAFAHATGDSRHLTPPWLPSRRDELLQRERLGQEIVTARVRQALLEGVLGVAGHEDDLEVGVALAQLLEQRRARPFPASPRRRRRDRRRRRAAPAPRSPRRRCRPRSRCSRATSARGH